MVNTTLHQNGSACQGSFEALMGMSRCLYNAMGELSGAWDAAAAGNSGQASGSVAEADAAISECNSWASRLSL